MGKIKTQGDCYRTINGQHYVNFCDVISPRDEEAVLEVKEKKLRHRVFKHPDGFDRLFVHKDDIENLRTC